MTRKRIPAPTEGQPANGWIEVETAGGTRRQIDLGRMRAMDLGARDWSTGVDLIDVFLPSTAGSAVVHTYSRWSDGHGGIRGDRYFEPDDALLAKLGQYFDEPALAPRAARSES